MLLNSTADRIDGNPFGNSASLDVAKVFKGHFILALDVVLVHSLVVLTSTTTGVDPGEKTIAICLLVIV